jgi:uncharacterized membrane protein
MNAYSLLKTVHIISSVVLVGVGFGSAFYLFCTNRTRVIQAQAVVARFVVLADWIFTTPAGFIQLFSGIALVHMGGWPISSPWVVLSLILYFLAGACWLPVLWLQIRMKQMLDSAMKTGMPLPALYWRYARRWEWLGYPAFIAMVVIYILMVNKPVFALSL